MKCTVHTENIVYILFHQNLMQGEIRLVESKEEHLEGL